MVAVLPVPPAPNIPLTMPVPEPIVAISGLLLVHIPPVLLLLKVVVRPTHTTGIPVLAGGDRLTVTVVVARQLPTVYVISVVPAVRPDSTPVVEPIVATAVLLL